MTPESLPNFKHLYVLQLTIIIYYNLVDREVEKLGENISFFFIPKIRI